MKGGSTTKKMKKINWRYDEETTFIRNFHEISVELPPMLNYPRGIVITEEDVNHGMDDWRKLSKGPTLYYRYVNESPVFLEFSEAMIKKHYKYYAKQARKEPRKRIQKRGFNFNKERKWFNVTKMDDLKQPDNGMVRSASCLWDSRTEKTSDKLVAV